MKNKCLWLACILLFPGFYGKAQTKIGDNPTVVQSSALLELESKTKGLRLPRIALNDVTKWTLDGVAVSGMLVYNESGSAPKGLYYWNMELSMWVQILNRMIDQTPFFDASTSFNSTSNIGKGLVFPQTDLTKFSFITEALDGTKFPSAFDGMIVYNIGTGQTLPGQGIQSIVKPGFYYFSNPTGVSTKSIVAGKWIRVVDGIESSSESTVYYGVLNTTTPTATDIVALTNKRLASGLYKGNFDLLLSSAGYYTLVLPVSWRNPSLKINGQDTWNILTPSLIVNIDDVSYQVWQTDVPILFGASVAVN